NAPFVSPVTRLEAALTKATTRPSAAMAALKDSSLPWVPSDATLTRSVTPVRRSWTKTSGQLGAMNCAPQTFESPGTRLEAKLSKATKRPSAEMAAPPEGPLPSVPSDATLTRSVTPVRRSWTKTSGQLCAEHTQTFVSPGTRLEATLPKATKRPSAEMDPPKDSQLPSVPSDAILTRSVTPVRRPWTTT